MSGILGTPKDMFANPSTRGPSAGINPGLPPLPLFDDKAGPVASDIKRQIAAMKDAERRFAPGNLMNMAGSIPEAGANDGIGDRAAALADARRRMQLDMAALGQSDPLNGMFSGGGMSDRFSNMRRNMMMNQDNMFPSRIGGGGGDMMNSMMRNRFNVSDNAPPQNEEEFDAEVENFLSTLGKQIKDSRKQQGNMGGSSMQGMSSFGGSSVMDRMMMMDEMMNRNLGPCNMNFPPFSNNPRQQMMGNNNDNPQLPEFEGMDPNSRSANGSPKGRQG